ncbi:MAG: DinB family protein [Roseiflexaceae bacterium]
MNELTAHIAKLSAFPARLHAFLAPLTDTQLTFRPHDKEWSILENIGHLIDIDRLYVERIDLMLSSERPHFAPFNPDDQVTAGMYQAKLLAELMATYTELRQATVAGLSTMAPDELTRVGIHTRFGEITIMRLVEILVNHDEVHYTQMSNNLTQ